MQQTKGTVPPFCFIYIRRWQWPCYYWWRSSNSYLDSPRNMVHFCAYNILSSSWRMQLVASSYYKDEAYFLWTSTYSSSHPLSLPIDSENSKLLHKYNIHTWSWRMHLVACSYYKDGAYFLWHQHIHRSHRLSLTIESENSKCLHAQ